MIDRTEGWPVGLYLAALIAKDSGDHGLDVSGDDRYVADYLYREALAKSCPNAISSSCAARRCSTSSPARCATPCSATPTPSNSSRIWLASNLFLVPLDRRREWFRYHGLFREFLLGELRHREPELVAKLHLRAADWYEANGVPASALEHLLNTAERDRCIQLLTELVLPTYQAGSMSTVQRWLSTVGDPAVASHPPLAVLAGWIAAMSGDVADTQRWIHFIDGVSFSLVPG